KIVISTVRDTLQLAPLGVSKVECVLNINSALGVVRQLLLRVLVQTQVLRLNAQVDVPLQASINPVLVPLFVLTRLDEELHLHLLELTSTENEVTWGDLVTERLTDVRDTERWLHA